MAANRLATIMADYIKQFIELDGNDQSPFHAVIAVDHLGDTLLLDYGRGLKFKITIEPVQR